MLSRYLIPCGAMVAMLAVIIGAFGAHALKDIYTEQQLGWHQTAFQYQMYHALAIILVGIITPQVKQQRLLIAAGISFLAGIILFSGSLYLLAYTQNRWLGAFTPLGGLSFIIGWLLLAVSTLPGNRS